MPFKSYASLIRLKNQVGTLLLFIPCLLGLLFCKGANVHTITLFFVSAFLARSCGCILNDIADRKIDGNTHTTAHRPLANNQLTTKQAIAFFIILLCLGLPLLFFYSTSVLAPLGIIGALVILYPYSKRFFSVPQLLLGIVYASGFLLAIVNHFEIPLTYLHPKVWIFYFGLVLWVMIFDTIYAKRDFSSDIITGIKSSTIFFAKYSKTSLIITIVLIAIFTAGLYTHFLLSIIIPFVISMVHNMRKQKEEAFRKINFTLIYLTLLANILFSIFALTPTHYIFLGINATIQSFSIFMKPSHGFKINVLCVIPLALLFLM